MLKTLIDTQALSPSVFAGSPLLNKQRIVKTWISPDNPLRSRVYPAGNSKYPFPSIPFESMIFQPSLKRWDMLPLPGGVFMIPYYLLMLQKCQTTT